VISAELGAAFVRSAVRFAVLKCVATAFHSAGSRLVNLAPRIHGAVFVVGACAPRLRPLYGLPATGRRVELPLCGIYTFDADDRLAGERIYYDRGTVLRQLGVFHEPVSGVGRICTLATHPLTIARAYARKLFRT